MRHLQLQILELLGNKDMDSSALLLELRQKLNVQEADVLAALALLLDNGRIEEHDGKLRAEALEFAIR